MNFRDLRAGAMSPPLHEQLGISEEEVAIYQRAVDSLNFLRIHGFLTESLAKRQVEVVLKKATTARVAAARSVREGPDGDAPSA